MKEGEGGEWCTGSLKTRGMHLRVLVKLVFAVISKLVSRNFNAKTCRYAYSHECCIFGILYSSLLYWVIPLLLSCRACTSVMQTVSQVCRKRSAMVQRPLLFYRGRSSWCQATLIDVMSPRSVGGQGLRVWWRYSIAFAFFGARLLCKVNGGFKYLCLWKFIWDSCSTYERASG